MITGEIIIEGLLLVTILCTIGGLGILLPPFEKEGETLETRNKKTNIAMGLFLAGLIINFAILALHYYVFPDVDVW
jgi:hypothetical protein